MITSSGDHGRRLWTEDQHHDAEAQVLVDAAQTSGLDEGSGLFFDFAANAGLRGARTPVRAKAGLPLR